MIDHCCASTMLKKVLTQPGCPSIKLRLNLTPSWNTASFMIYSISIRIEPLTTGIFPLHRTPKQQFLSYQSQINQSPLLFPSSFLCNTLCIFQSNPYRSEKPPLNRLLFTVSYSQLTQLIKMHHSTLCASASLLALTAAAPLVPRNCTENAPARQYYVCASNGFRGYCSVDPCAREGCPDYKVPDPWACPSGENFYICASNGFKGCSSNDECAKPTPSGPT
jgi:hypothetical protein